MLGRVWWREKCGEGDRLRGHWPPRQSFSPLVCFSNLNIQKCLSHTVQVCPKSSVSPHWLQLLRYQYPSSLPQQQHPFLEITWKFDTQLKACQSKLLGETRQKPFQNCAQTDLGCKGRRAPGRDLNFAWPLPLIHCNAFCKSFMEHQCSHWWRKNNIYFLSQNCPES